MVDEIGARTGFPAVLFMLIETTAEHQRHLVGEVNLILQKQCPVNGFCLSRREPAMFQRLPAPLPAQAEIVAGKRHADAAVDDFLSQLLTRRARRLATGITVALHQLTTIGTQRALSPAPIATVG